MKKIFSAVGVLSIFIFAGFIFYSSGLFTYNKDIADLVYNGAHTGLEAPLAGQVALNDRDEADSQFASNPENQIGGNTLASNNMPRVLFDISAKPVFGQRNYLALILWAAFFSIILFVSADSIYKAYKRAKLKKIKEDEL
jgi:hypothetical protein